MRFAHGPSAGPWPRTCPLNLLLVIRRPNLRGVVRALLSASRSSAFLGAFITLFYYGVCLARTRLGPHISAETHGRARAIDGGICVGSGCLLCGCEHSHRECRPKEGHGPCLWHPRALATSAASERYRLDMQWRETFVLPSAPLSSSHAFSKIKGEYGVNAGQHPGYRA